MTQRARLVPELYVSDLIASLSFYTGVLGLQVAYDRPEDRFASLTLNGAEVMLEQPTDPARTWIAGELQQPHGRGINLQIEVDDVRALLRWVENAGVGVHLDLEDRWCRVGDGRSGNRQFVVRDPDGDLLRFFQSPGAPAPVGQ